MNFTKQNNPVAIGVLVVILIGALYGVFVQIKHVQAAMAADNAAHKPEPQQETQDTSSADTRVVLNSYTRPRFGHDPFTHPVNDTSTVPAPRPLRTPKIPSIPRLPTRSGLSIEPLPISGPTTPTPASNTASTTEAAKPATDPKSLRVTAIIKGARATAIVEGAGPRPMPVSEGDTIGDLKVEKVSDDGIIVSGASGIYTLSISTEAAGQRRTDAGPVQETANVAQ